MSNRIGSTFVFKGTGPIARMTRTLTRRPAPAEAFHEHRIKHLTIGRGFNTAPSSKHLRVGEGRPLSARPASLLPPTMAMHLLRRFSFFRPRRTPLPGLFCRGLDCSFLLNGWSLQEHLSRFEEGDLTAPSLANSEVQLARAISEFVSLPPNEASIETLQRRLNPKY